MTTRLFLIRHGQSVAQVERIISGHDTCRGLSDLGRRQVEALRDRLLRTGEIRADVVLSSLLPRAVETAQILGPAIGGGEALQDCDLCEIHAGEAEGLTWEEYEARYTGSAMFDEAPPAPGQESVREFAARVDRALRRYAEEHDGRTIVAAVHGGIIEQSLATFLDLEPLQVAVSMIVNTSITEWTYERHPFRASGEQRWALVRFNDFGHLAGTDLLRADD